MTICHNGNFLSLNVSDTWAQPSVLAEVHFSARSPRHRTMDQLVRLVNDAATSFATIPINADSEVFKSFKGLLTEAYRDIPVIRSLLDAKGSPEHSALPRRPQQRAHGFRPPPRLRRHSGGRPAVFKETLTAMPPPKPNMEKILQMREKVRPFVTDEYRNDVLYAPPTESQVKDARTIK